MHGHPFIGNERATNDWVENLVGDSTMLLLAVFFYFSELDGRVEDDANDRGLRMPFARPSLVASLSWQSPIGAN
jgi:hypothetical protein